MDSNLKSNSTAMMNDPYRYIANSSRFDSHCESSLPFNNKRIRWMYCFFFAFVKFAVCLRYTQQTFY